jgi:cell wall-associated NlpC family hydrolase
MSVHGRSARRALIVALAVPIIAAVYLATLITRLASLPRLFLVAVLGAPVIGAVYAEEAYRHAPDGLRRGLELIPTPRITPLKAAAVMGLAVALLMTSAPAAPAEAAGPREAVIDIAQSYLGTPYRLGAEGPAVVDCSGLIFRVFADTGQLHMVGGNRKRAVGYLRWFTRRGMASKTNGEKGDLVVWGGGKHIGIYLGDGKVISALLDQGVTVHGLHNISYKFTTFLKVNWKLRPAEREKPGDNEGRSRKKKDKERDGVDRPNAEPAAEEAEEATASESLSMRGVATGTLNLRRGHDPEERVIGWVSKGSRFTITGTGHSPSGALWYSIEMHNGKTGWVYSRWVEPLDD